MNHMPTDLPLMRLSSRLTAVLWAAVLLVLSSGCGDDDTGATGNGSAAGNGAAAGSGGNGDDGALGPTFENVYFYVFEAHGCNAAQNCHGASGAGSLQMRDLDQAYEQLVGAPAAGEECGDSGLTRVVPGDPANSLLMMKMLDEQECGFPMPVTGLLPDEEIDLVRRWIQAGAPND